MLFELETTAMQYRIVKMRWISREFVRANRDRIFLFGDNLVGQGFGGQAAAMRGEPNCVGIPTKKFPSGRDDAFFTDLEFEQNKAAIDHAFEVLFHRISKAEQIIVIPADGLGTGRAQLESRAPLTFAYLQKCLKALSHK